MHDDGTNTENAHVDIKENSKATQNVTTKVKNRPFVYSL